MRFLRIQMLSMQLAANTYFSVARLDGTRKKRHRIGNAEAFQRGGKGGHEWPCFITYSFGWTLSLTFYTITHLRLPVIN